MAGKCEHQVFDCTVTVNRLEDTGRFNADVRVRCVQCDTPFRFIGLPAGLDLNGASVSIDGTEARLAIAPKGEVATPLETTGIQGFTVRKADRDFKPGECADCGMRVDTDAEAYIHATMHGDPDSGIRKLPYSMFGDVAKMMAEYKRSH